MKLLPCFLITLLTASGLGEETGHRNTLSKNWSLHWQYDQFIDLPFHYSEFKKLKENEVPLYFEAYPPDTEMQQKLDIEQCIRGEAPTFEAALKKFPLVYPRHGRMLGITGTLIWEKQINGKTELRLKTATQNYGVHEYFLLRRLEDNGFTNKSPPTRVTLDACWHVNQIFGLYLQYIEGLELHPDSVVQQG